MRTLGWDTDQFITPVKDLTPLIKAVDEVVTKESLTDSDDLKLLGDLAKFFAAVRSLAAIGSGSLPATIDVTAFKAEFPSQLRDFLLVEYLLARQARLGRLLQVLGILRLIDVPAEGNRPAFTRRELAWDDLASALDDPGAVFRNAYKWGDNDFDAAGLLKAIYWLADAHGLGVQYGVLNSSERSYLKAGAVATDLHPTDERIVRWEMIKSPFSTPRLFVGVGAARLPQTASDKPGLAILPYLHGSADTEFPLNDAVSASFKADFALAGGVAIRLRSGKAPSLERGFLEGLPAAGVAIQVGLSAGGEEPIVLIGQPASSRLQVGSLALRGGARARTGGQSGSSAFVELELANAALVISTGSGDGFLKKVLGDGATVEFGATLGIDSEQGLCFTGSSALEIQIPAHISLGPVELRSATVAIKPKDGAIPVELTATIGVDLTVIKGVVENVGIAAKLTPQDDGNLGPFQFDIGFRPPNGVGVVVDAGVVRGGGYLFFDREKEEYGGALELTISEIISVKAIGLLNTRMPGGEKGFSLLVIMTAEFGTPIQLSFGFVLIGVGGMVGVNRAVRKQPLIEGTRTGAVNNILFPKDVIANAPKIFDNLRTILPPEEGTFVVGPFLKLGWGTPPIITLSLGILIEIPGDIVILGVLSAALPEDEPILILQVAFVGVIEYSRKRLYFFAVLYDSSIVRMPLDGEMGVLAAFGDDANLLVSAGGFHPRYNPPALPFPKPARMSLEILNRSNAKIRAESYFCVTSNTVQLGVRAEAYFGFDACKIEGDIRFDCLFRFSPFHFEIDFSASFDAKVFGVGWFSISVKMSLEGPTPWRAHGKGKIAISMAPDVSVCFSKTWGSEGGTSLPPVNVFPVVAAEFALTANWQTSLTPGTRLLVTLRASPTPESAILVHPTGMLRVSQRAVPIDLTLDKVGNQKPRDLSKLTLRVADTSVMKRVDDALEQFAAAQFQSLTDGQKLSRAGFEPMHGGLILGRAGEPLVSARTVRRRVRYDTITIDSKNPTPRSEIRLAPLPLAMFRRLIRNGSVGRSPFSKLQQQRLGGLGQRITVIGEQFGVARLDTNKQFGTSPAFSSESAAREYMNGQIATNPALADQLHVVPTYEVVP
jgi:hypothetical protein